VTVEKHSSFYEQFAVKSISTLLDPHVIFVIGNPDLSNILYHASNPWNLNS